jgi:hypothetical protein
MRVRPAELSKERKVKAAIFMISQSRPTTLEEERVPARAAKAARAV